MISPKSDESPVPLGENQDIEKRTRCLTLTGSTILDKSGTPITPTAGVYDKLATEGWKWDSTSNTLTLNGVNIETGGADAAIQLPATATVETVGTNSVTSTASFGIHVTEDTGVLTLTGDGSLNVNSFYLGIRSLGDISITSGTINVKSTADSAIFAAKDLSVTNANVTATAKFCGLQANGNSMAISKSTVVAKSEEDSAIFTTGSLDIGNSANVTATAKLCGLQANGTKLTISDSTVAATSSNDSAIFTKGSLDIKDSPDVTATALYAGLQANGSDGITISDSTVATTSSGGSALFTAGNLVIKDSSDVTTTAKFCGFWADGSDGVTISGSTVVATSSEDAAIFTKGSVVIENSSDVTATGMYAGFSASENITITGGKVNARSNGANAIDSVGDFTAAAAAEVTANGQWAALRSKKNITLNGTLKATGNEHTAIMAEGGTITVGATADIAASSTVGAGLFAKKGITTAGIIDAVGNANGIISHGPLKITGGKIHAKGGPSAAAICTLFTKSGNAEASAQITLAGMIEKSGYKVAFSDWKTFEGSNCSWTSFIAKDDTKLNTMENGNMDNSANEIYLAVPHTVTFDANGGSGTYPSVPVYPGNKVTAPDTIPTKDGFHFSGWYLDETKFDFENTPVTTDVALKATFDTHTPRTDDGDCTTPIKCSVCEAITTAAATDHDWGDADVWESNGDKHWQKCKNTSCTQKRNNGDHIWDAGTITQPATHAETGVTTFTCTTCPKTRTETIPKSAEHTGAQAWSSDNVNHWHDCTLDDDGQTDLAAHTFGEWVTDKPATATEEGSKHRDCLECAHSEIVVLTVELVDNATNIKAEYANGSPFDSTIVLSVTSKPQTEMDHFKDNVEEAAPGLVLGGLYDVKLLKDGVSVQPNGDVKVSIPLTDKLKAMTDLKVVYIKDDGNVTIIDSEVKDGVITFITKHFSNYGVIGKVKATDPGNNNSGESGNGNGNGNGSENNNGTNNSNGRSPQTGDSSSILFFLLIMIASGTALVILCKKRHVCKHLKK